MRSIETSGLPLAFPVAGEGLALPLPQQPDAGLALRVYAGALEGMQKQALVHDGGNGRLWQMVCDEGPYLNGTDLAPFPLAFFTTGMALSVLGEIEALAKRRGIDLGTCSLIIDNRYGMEGSALRGDMTGSALPVDLTLKTNSTVSRTELNALVADAVMASPANALLRGVYDSLFSIRHNDAPIVTGRVSATDAEAPAFPKAALAAAGPDAGRLIAEPIIEKLQAAETVFGVEGGAGSSLAADQKRTLHVRGFARRRADGLYEVKTQLFKPIGSVFRFLGDGLSRYGGGDRAPSALAYLSAGLAFCFLTQLGRFAHIAKMPLDHYGVVQDTRFSEPQASAGGDRAASAETVVSHVDVGSSESADAMRRLVDMGEQTCFLHAVCRTALRPRIHIEKEG